MQFYTLASVPILPADVVYRESRLTRFIGLAIVMGLIALPTWIWWKGGMPGWVLGPILALMSLFVWGFGLALLRSFGAENWVVRQTPTGLYVKFRTFLNEHFDDRDEVVVRLERSDIASIRPVYERVVSQGDGNRRHIEFCRYLDIRLAGVDMALLKGRIDAERNRPAPEARVRTKFTHCPVRVIGDDVLRIEWYSHQSMLTPRLATAIEWLRPLVRKVEPEQRIESDLTVDAGTHKEGEGKILDLIERGDRITAYKVARRMYRISDTEARQFVDELAGRDAA
jgi:hypothetical protein